MQRIEALRNQLRHPYAILDTTLRWYLMRANWDVNTAAQSFIRRNSSADPDRNAPTQGADPHPVPPVRGGRTLEASRIIAVQDVGAFLRRPPDPGEAARRARHLGPPPSNANLVQIFHSNNWDVNAVINSVAARRSTVTKQEQDDAVDPRAEARVEDRAMRSVEDTSLEAMSNRPVGDHERDERLAWFISATGTQSWYSAAVALQNVNWNVTRALDNWLQQGGIREVPAPDDIPNQGRRDVDLDAMPLLLPNTNVTAHRMRRDLDPTRLTFTGGFTSSLPRPALLPTQNVDYEHDRPNRRGYIIDEDRRPANLNCPDATKLRVEVIRDLQYTMTEFSGQAKVGDRYLTFRWNDDDTSADPAASPSTDSVEFDWSNPTHITLLNRWREEHIRRLTGELRRPATVPFNKYEKDWLREQEAIRYETEFGRLYTRNYPGAQADAIAFFADGSNFPLEMDNAELRALTAAFNAEFAGRVSYQKVKAVEWNQKVIYVKSFDQPRPWRSVEMIRSQRVRVRALCRQFMKPFNDSHGTGRGVEEGSESDSDFEQERRGGEGVGGQGEGNEEDEDEEAEGEGEDEDEDEEQDDGAGGNAGFFTWD
jgi:hypothetical protein